jgi:excinuclease ABC subunit A
VFSNRFELDGITFEKPTVHFFSFNNPFGACKECGGYGSIIGVDEDRVIPNKGLSVYDNAVACWRGEKMSKWKNRFILKAAPYEFPVHKPYMSLTKEQRTLLWKGNDKAKGIDSFFKYVERKSYKIQYRVMLSRYRGKTICPECEGTKLRKDVGNVKIGGSTILDLLVMPLDELSRFFSDLKLDGFDMEVSGKLLKEIIGRLAVLCDVGLGYLTLSRSSNSLSGGEAQRINLATSLGSTLVGSLYILDEPSIGLHPKDTEKLVGVLKKLKEIGNTVIVVEHDEDIMRASDQIIDMGPLAGLNGGHVVFQGGHNEIEKEKKSLTAQYLQGKLKIGNEGKWRKWNSSITISGARENNLKGINITFPLHTLTVVTGVSGSGKSTLVSDILHPVMSNHLNGFGSSKALYEKMEGDIDQISHVEFVNQNPIGKSSRSNPVTYIKAWDDIRALFANLPQSKQMGYKSRFFSFNVDGGRCEECNGEGTINIEMQFMADVKLVCEDCNGTRFKTEILELEYRGKNVADILELTVDEGIGFFENEDGSYEKSIIRKLSYLQDVGMGYVKLGQPSSTLSGGEAQRVKLASFLAPEKKVGKVSGEGYGSKNHSLFIFDEPTTGLHFHDINKLLSAFNALIDTGNSIIVIEHNLEVINNADWVIDLGPEGGNMGGELVFAGPPEELVKEPGSYTGQFLRAKLS